MGIYIPRQAAFISVAAEIIIAGYTLPGFLSTFQNAEKKCRLRITDCEMRSLSDSCRVRQAHPDN